MFAGGGGVSPKVKQKKKNKAAVTVSLLATYVNAPRFVSSLSSSRQTLWFINSLLFPPFSGTLEVVQAANCPTQYAFFTRLPVTSSPALICSYMDMLCIAWAAKYIIYAQSASTRLLLFSPLSLIAHRKAHLLSTRSSTRLLAGQVRRNIKARKMSGLSKKIKSRRENKWRDGRRRWRRLWTRAAGVDILIASVQLQKERERERLKRSHICTHLHLQPEQ